MEVKETSKKREIIKSIAIVFLVILLLLTFFSNTIMNRSLPEVAAKSISSGTINAKIRGSGTVEATENYEVVINQTREVRSVCVQVGDIVSQGDLLFVLGDVESQELKSAQEQLDALNLQYQQRLLQLSREYASEDRAIAQLQQELSDAVRERDENQVTDTEISDAKGQAAAAKQQLAQLGLLLEGLQDQLAEDAAYQEAKSQVEKLKTQVETAQAQIKEYTEQLNALNTSGSSSTDRALQDALTAVNAASDRLESDWNAYREIYGRLLNEAGARYGGFSQAVLSDSSAQIQVETYLTQESLKIPDSETDPQHPEYSLFAKAQEVLTADYDTLTAAEQTYQRLRDDSAAAQDDVYTKRAALREKLNQANSEYTSANMQLQQAQSTLSETEKQNAALKDQIKQCESSQRQQATLVESLNSVLTELEAKKLRFDQAVKLVEEKKRAIENALGEKGIDQQLNDLELESTRKQIEKAQAQVDKYTEQSVDTEVHANVSGRISAIHVTAGKENAAGSAMATIELVDRGYLLKIPVTNEQSRQVKVGDTAKITNYYWGNDIEAVLESVIPDPSKPGAGKLLLFRIHGEVDAGTNLTLSIGQRSANYDTIVPKSALREDANGYFVLVITVKSTPLSNRYLATRVGVQVLAEDDTSAAVSGLSAGDFVITTSSKPVEAGSQVRMVEQ